MKLVKYFFAGLFVCAWTPVITIRAKPTEPVYPGKEWTTKKPEDVGLDEKKLKELSNYAGGSGCVVRHGVMVYTWGDASRRRDIASAAKPFYSHFLFKALEDGKINSLDEKINQWEPRLNQINKDLRYKDRDITWRHCANQISCYGLTDAPGSAFAYNDWQMALFWDTLFLKVYGASFETVDDKVFHPMLTDVLQCQDNPTFMAFGVKDRPGRTGISPRDFARFGLLYLRKGRWKDKHLITREHATMAVTSPLPGSFPRAGKKAAEMIPDQRSIGSKRIPDNQCDHVGSYSWLWWTNGVDRHGARHWPDVPVDAYGCFGHGGLRAMVVLPSLDMIISWNDTKIRGADMENRVLGLLTQAASATVHNRHLGDKAAVMWNVVEWSIETAPDSGNPFDVSANATFTHTDSGCKHVTGMFYDGQGAWRFRFAPNRMGNWTFITESDLASLDGYTGSVTVAENPNKNVKGFLTHIGNKYAIQIKDVTDLQGYLFNVYMGRVRQSVFLDDFGSDLGQVEKKALACLDEAKQNGFEIIFVHVNNSWFKFGVRRHDRHDSENPDPISFAVLETIIKTVHRAGGRVHIWAWGDESRKWTPIGVPGGINGVSDRRLQRYIAFRLGPLPGWTMGYGFDLHEWTNTRQLNAWAKFLHERFGWQHLLCARGFRLEGDFNMHSYDGFGRNVPLKTTSHGPKNYQEIVEDMDGDSTRPHLYEERHSYKREGFDLDMEGTRRLLWWESMAGGMGGFFGFYPDSPHPYPNPEQLRTHYTCWHTNNRFKLNMQRANRLSHDGLVLSVPSNTHYVFYGENISSMNMDLSDMKDTQSAIAVDTKKEYREIEIGKLRADNHIWKAPYHSDWVLAVGDFDGEPLTSNRSYGSDGRIVVDPEHPQWLKRNGCGSFFMCGPGDPEDFLYRGELKSDGTRSGDQMQLIEKMKNTGANCIYLMAVRSHGGDGDKTHNPFVDHDPRKGFNPKVLDQWERWFTAMDRNGIVIYFFFYDDNVQIWRTGDEVGMEEKNFIQTLVDRFEHHKNLIWCIAEEYQEGLTVERVKKIATQIRTADDHDHAIAVHKLNGLDFSEFADEPNIDQFAIQYNVQTAEELHAGVVKAWRQAKGRYNLNLSEAADWGTGFEARKKSWACAMGGAYVMILRMDIATTPRSDLEDCGRLVHFFESTTFNEMVPHDELGYGGTKYVLARPGRSYIAYTPDLQGEIGLKNLLAGRYTFVWFDCTTGMQVTKEDINVSAGDQSWEKPESIGNELAVYIKRVGTE